MPARRTSLYARHVEAGGRMVDFAGWEMPQQYASVREEHLAVRRAAGLFDVSHMGRVEVSGPGAAGFLQGLLTNDLDRLAPGRAQYTLMCAEDGGVLDDLVVYRHAEDRFLVVVNAGNREKDGRWMRDHAGAGVELVDRSDELCLLAFQGPLAESVLPAALDLASIPYFGFARGEVAGVEATVCRTGYTGEDGFELFVPADRAAGVWDALLEAGARVGVRPCGLAARDVCRLEAGLRLYGSDMDESTNPYEAGLGWTVKLRKGEFVGREALVRVKEEGPVRETVGLRGEGRTIPRHGAEVSLEGAAVGAVTSGTFSFFLESGIGMAMVAAGKASLGSRVEVGGRGAGGLAEVVGLPFYRGSVKQPAAPAKQ